ncbi:MAG: hypothetical protein J0L88_15130 [Xanthomonadales bacterium]|nr:hypothetical protein [Xanthomonadales bacterium]
MAASLRLAASAPAAVIRVRRLAQKNAGRVAVPAINKPVGIELRVLNPSLGFVPRRGNVPRRDGIESGAGPP